MNSNAIVNQAFNALEETAQIVRGELEIAKNTKKKNAAYWHAMLFSAVSKNPSKLQQVCQRLEQWINDDMDVAVAKMIGGSSDSDEKNNNNKLQQQEQQQQNASAAASASTTSSSSPTSPVTDTTTDQPSSEVAQLENEIDRELEKARLVDEAAAQKICESFAAYKRIAFAATVIFEVLGSSKTVKIDITKMMLAGYRDKIFRRVKGSLLKYIFYHVSLCRKKEEMLPSGGGLIKNACRMFATIAQQYDRPHDRIRFYDFTFVRKYHAHALEEARADLQDYLRQPLALDGLLAWAEERISFELRLVELILHDEHASDVNDPLERDRFRKQLQYLFIVPHLEGIITHSSFGFSANLTSGNWTKLKQQFSWATAEKSRCPKAAELISTSLVEYAKNQVESVIKSFNDQNFDSTANAATFLITGLYDLLKLIFKNLLSSFADEGAAAALHRPVQKEISRLLAGTTLKRNIKDAKSGKLNTTDDNFADILCIYVDMVLRDEKLLPSGDDYQTFSRNQVATLFSVLEDRDIFAEHYRLRLAKRLLQTNWEEDNELAVLEVLQRQVGKLYTHKFEGMIFDVQNASSLQELYSESGTSSNSAAAASSSSVSSTGKLEPKVLTAAYWPTLKRDDDFVSPEALTIELGKFERFYRKKFPTRQLRWQAERGTASLAVSFPKGVREVNCSLYQAAVMIAIDESSGVDLKNSSGTPGIILNDLSKKVGIEMKELKPLVASMLLAKGLNLIRTVGVNPLNPKFTESDSVEMNPDFACRIRKIKLPSAITARSVSSESVGSNVIAASRGQMLDATIVRIMKSRKQMRMQEIVDTVLNQVTKFFIPQPRDIKMRVEFLIQKEFLERDDDEKDLFRYLA